MELPEHIKQKIADEALRLNPVYKEPEFLKFNYWSEQDREQFTDAAYFGYSLAKEEIEYLKTVMIAAAEEINLHWDAHCDSEGYGPSSLLKRLEDGIPASYGYTAGRFEELKNENERLKELLERVVTREYSEVRQTKKNKEEVWNKFKTENNL